MYFKYIPGVWSLALSFFIVMLLGLFSVVYYRVRGAKLFGFCMLFLGGWTICKGLAILGADYYTRNIWACAGFCLYMALHMSWFFMVLQFGGGKDWLKWKRLLALLLLPVLSSILVWTKPFADLTYYGYIMDSSVHFPLAGKPHGWLLLLIPVYIYTLDLLAIVLVIRRSLFYKSIYGMKMSSFVLGPIISVCPSILYLLSFWLIKGYDITAVFMSVSSVIAAAGGYHLFVSAPVAREAAVDNINIAILVVNNYGNIADMNHAARQMFEKRKQALLGLPANEVFANLSSEISELQDGDSKEIEYLDRQNGQTRFLRAQRMPINNKKGATAGYVVLISDITEMRMERLRMLQQTSAVVANREREKLARDLHDNLAQVLASISMQAQGICNELEYEETEKVYRDLTRLVGISQSAHSDIREYIHSVRNALAGEKNLPEVARTAIEEFCQLTGVMVRTDIQQVEALDRLNGGHKANLYYILKECLNNIRKHAIGVKTVTISMKQEKDNLCFAVSDDGCGFNLADYDGNRFGLNIMRERADEIDAKLIIQSKPGKGTQVRLEIPLAKEGITC
ncbi:MAG: histidine kinase N-terminal 7TM domain-containing protein [Christensenella sp.]|nr:histidine kinase N-terminal 7TM domain-containing protein [Christensenella sp.]